MRAAIYRLVSILPVALTCGALLWALSLSPFTRPLVAQSASAVRAEIDRQLVRALPPERAGAMLQAAVARGDLDAAQMLLDEADRLGIALPPALLADAEVLRAAQGGWLAGARDCAICAADIRDCPRLALLASCGLTVEMTVVGDANALRRAGVAYLAGEEVDRLDVSMAVVGLSATALVLVSGGSSLTIKAGATSLRVARRLGTLTAGFAGELVRLADIGLKWDRVPAFLVGRIGLGDVADAARVHQLAGVATDLGRVREATSLTETLHLLRHVDGVADARRLADTAEALGPRTRPAFELLGKGRVFRALVRLSDLVLATLALAYALALQIAVFVAERLGRATLGALRGVLGGG